MTVGGTARVGQVSRAGRESRSGVGSGARAQARGFPVYLAAVSALVVVLMANPTTAASPVRVTFTAPFSGGTPVATHASSTCGSGSGSSSASANLSTGVLYGAVNGSAATTGDCAHARGSSGIAVTFTSNQSARGSVPSGRNNAMMVYDAKDGYTVLFGGLGASGLLRDTWTFHAGVWTQIHPKASPPAETGAAMVYDASDGYVLLYDGPCGASCNTWSFSGGAWTNITPSTSPTARNVGYLAYDAADGYVVLFGGFTGAAYLNDTWTYHAGNWTQLNTSVAPSPRADSNEGGLVYDAYDGYLLLFGGDSGWGSAPYYNDTWTFLHGSWAPLSLSVSPAARAYQTMSYDPLLRSVIMFGGIANPKVFTDTWGFSGGRWIALHLSAAPPGNFAPSSVYDAASRAVVLFGGSVSGAGGATSPTQTWTFRHSRWAELGGAGQVSVGLVLRWTAQTKVQYHCVYIRWYCFHRASSIANVVATVNLSVVDVTPNATPTAPFGSSSLLLDLAGSSSSSSPSGGMAETLYASGSVLRHHTYQILVSVSLTLYAAGSAYTFGTSRYNLPASAFVSMSSPYGTTVNWITAG